MARAHIVTSYDADLDELVNAILSMGGLAETAFAGAMTALAERDAEAAARVIENDARLDELEEAVDQRAVHLFALRQPMAQDLRLIAMSLKISNDLERIGDYAASIAKRARRLAAEAPPRATASLKRMGERLQAMLADVLDAYAKRDARKAMTVWHRDVEVDDIYDGVFRELLGELKADPRATSAGIDLLFIAKNLERIGDHTTNIAERVHYVVHGDRINRMRGEPAPA
jgi:phosphate transport system protein